jgi:hypothetical protein
MAKMRSKRILRKAVGLDVCNMKVGFTSCVRNELLYSTFAQILKILSVNVSNRIIYIIHIRYKT